VQPYERRAEEIAEDRRSVISRHVRLFEDAAGRIVRREVNDIRRAVKRYLGKDDVAGFLSWLAQFYEDLREALPGYFEPLMESLAETISAEIAAELDGDDVGLTDDLRSFISEYLEKYASGYTVGDEKQLRSLIADADEDPEAATELINGRLDEWEQTKPHSEGLAQAFEFANAIAVAVYAAAGVAFLRWFASGQSCPYCQRMHGRMAPTGATFVEAGGSVDGDDGEPPMKVSRNIKHPPVHRGCDCVLTAG
jgi:hypothetical protein